MAGTSLRKIEMTTKTNKGVPPYNVLAIQCSSQKLGHFVNVVLQSKTNEKEITKVKFQVENIIWPLDKSLNLDEIDLKIEISSELDQIFCSCPGPNHGKHCGKWAGKPIVSPPPEEFLTLNGQRTKILQKWFKES